MFTESPANLTIKTINPITIGATTYTVQLSATIDPDSGFVTRAITLTNPNKRTESYSAYENITPESIGYTGDYEPYSMKGKPLRHNGRSVIIFTVGSVVTAYYK